MPEPERKEKPPIKRRREKSKPKPPPPSPVPEDPFDEADEHYRRHQRHVDVEEPGKQ